MSAFKATLLHALELAITFVVAFLVLRFFKVEGEAATLLLTLVLNGLAKFARTTDKLPVPDYTRVD